MCIRIIRKKDFVVFFEHYTIIKNHNIYKADNNNNDIKYLLVILSRDFKNQCVTLSYPRDCVNLRQYRQQKFIWLRKQLLLERHIAKTFQDLFSNNMTQTILILKVFLSLTASFLHCVGFWALWHVKQTNPYLITQRLYLLHLSLAENVHSLCFSLHFIFKIYEQPKWSNYAFICAGGGAFIWHLSIMTMLTVDRFLTVYLNVRYLVVWNVQKTKRVLIACSLIAFIFNIVFLVTLPTFSKAIEFLVIYLIFPVVNIFTLIAILTYIYIFRRVYKRPKKGCGENSSSNGNGIKSRAYTVSRNNEAFATVVLNGDPLSRSAKFSSLPKIAISKSKFPKRTFVIPLLLISTFIVFIGFPDNTYFWYFILDKEVPPALDTLFFIFYPTGIMSDAIIYVLFAKDVRAFLFRKLGIGSERKARGESQN